MLKKRGITLVEIIISIALISIVLLALFNLLIAVNDINNESEIDSTYLINKSLLVKSIQDDLSHFTVKNATTSCNFSSITSLTGKYDKNKAKGCVKLGLTDGTNDTDAYIAIYYSTSLPEKVYVISYIHGENSSTRELKDFEKYNVSGSTLKKSMSVSVLSTGTSGHTFHKINIPIIGPDGKDYSILISHKNPK